jgi:diadenylate cyclase
VGSLFAFLLPVWHVAWGFRWRDVLDVALMTFLVYQVYLRFRGTRAARIGAGLAALGVFYFLAQAAGLFLTTWVLGGIWAASFILMVVVFQVEIRQIFEQMNLRIPSVALFRRTNFANGVTDFLVTIADACSTLASQHHGALFVFERRDAVEPLLRGKGVVIDAQVSSQLVENLCTPPTPLHDGALYLREGRVYRAGCILPLSESLSLPYFYGTRHRAAVGVTENSDAVVVVVSEERGTISVVERGKVVTLPGPQELAAWLGSRLSGAPEKDKGPWLGRTLITYDWQAKLGALAAVGMLWLILVGPQNTEVGFTIPVVYYDIPANLDLDGKRTQEVYLRVRGSRELLSLLDSHRLRAQINLKETREGTSNYSLSAQEVNLPLGLQVAGMDPPVVTVRLKKKPLPEKAPEKTDSVKEKNLP